MNRPARSAADRLERFLLTERSAALRYAAAAAMCGLFLGVMAVLQWLEGSQLGSVMLLAVVLSAVSGGLGPALLAAVLAALAVDYYYAEPLFTVLDSWASALRVVTFSLIGAVVAGIVAALRSAYRTVHLQYREAEQATRGRDHMMAVVSHDLRSPLSAALLGVVAAKRAVEDGAPREHVRSALDSVHRAAATMKRLLDDLRDVAVIEAGRFSVELIPQNLQPLLEHAVEAARLSGEAKRVTIGLHVDNVRYPVRGDPDRLMQVFSNLIDNAVKFSPEGARVDVRARRGDDWIEIEVQDSGPGIAKDHLSQVFELHWQAPETAHLGSGLGLFIVRSIVEAHGGRVEAHAGQGALFKVYLPAASEP